MWACLVGRDWLFETPWNVARQPPLSVGFSRQEYWSGLPFPPPGDLPDPGIKLMPPASGGGFFTTELLGKPSILYIFLLKFWRQVFKSERERERKKLRLENKNGNFPSSSGSCSLPQLGVLGELVPLRTRTSLSTGGQMSHTIRVLYLWGHWAVLSGISLRPFILCRSPNL